MNNNVLFVDDEVYILKALKRGLVKETYNKFYASSGKEALEILESVDIHVIVSDMKMPQMNGLDLLTIVNEKYPHIVKIILSGYTQLQQVIVTINRINIYKYLTKPWDMELEFKRVIYSAVDMYNTQIENENLKASLIKKNELYQNMIKSNSEKIGLMKNDFSFLENMNKVLVNFYYLMGVKLKRGDIADETYREELATISHLYGDVIGVMPTKHNEFNVHMMQEKINKFLNDNRRDGNVASRISITNNNEVYLGNLSILCFTITSLLKYYFSLDDYDAFDITVTDKEKINEEGHYVELLFRIKSERNHVLTERFRLHTINAFFVNMVESYHGTLSFESINHENLVLISFPFRLKQTAHEAMKPNII